MALDFALHKLCIERVSVLVEQLPCPRLKTLQKRQLLLLSEYGKENASYNKSTEANLYNRRYCDG